MGQTRNLINNVTIAKVDFVFDFQEFYTHAGDWIKWRGFGLIESKYVEKVTPDGKDYEIHWLCEKDIDDYSRQAFNIIWKMTGVNDVEASVDRKKIKLQKGSIIMDLSAYIEEDIEGKWGGDAIRSLFKQFFERYIYRSTKKRIEEELWGISWEYHSEIKSFLELYKYN